jgi:uncharacterized protein (UPF0212 family)
MEKEQTATDWLIEQLTAIGVLEVPTGSNAVSITINEAKKRERNNVVYANIQIGLTQGLSFQDAKIKSEKYYDLKFKTEK